MTGLALAPVLTVAPNGAWAEGEGASPVHVSATPTPSLSHAARSGGRYYGAAARADHLRQDKALRAAILRDCEVLTPEIHLKWNSLEWRKGQFHFTPVDDLLAFADENGLRVRGHTLLWDQSTPDWAKHEMLDRRDWRLMSEHFSRVLGRYASRIDEWDVINEPIDTVSGAHALRRNTFFRAFGPTYIERAMEEARAHAPHAHLVINDYGFEYGNPVDKARRQAFVALARRLRAARVPLDGVGVQAHLDLSKGPIDRVGLQEMTKALIDLGLDITVTELDVKETEASASTPARDQKVADETRRYLDVMLAFPEVRGVVTWGLTDKFSWLTEQVDARVRADRGVNRGLPYDDAYSPKPMYWALADTLRASA
ncbi:endo-1,4-beta-xylanase [Brevundimonas sp.]|uniref:endo-1,4-beta-xylanase n=1 Tax=Brevundimonas sp. TaxID=1871086 RepID=UPI0028A99686|nr:endo-1,4-beta-xylanase [Brevundimonas sp.]